MGEKLYTTEEFWEITRLPENDERRLELDNGIIHKIAPSIPINAVIAARLGYFLNT